MIAQATTQPVTEGWNPQNIIALVAALTALLGAFTNWQKIRDEKYNREKLEAKHETNTRDIRDNKTQLEVAQTDIKKVLRELPPTATVPVIPVAMREVMKEGTKE